VKGSILLRRLGGRADLREEALIHKGTGVAGLVEEKNALIVPRYGSFGAGVKIKKEGVRVGSGGGADTDHAGFDQNVQQCLGKGPGYSPKEGDHRSSPARRVPLDNRRSCGCESDDGKGGSYLSHKEIRSEKESMVSQNQDDPRQEAGEGRGAALGEVFDTVRDHMRQGSKG